MSLVYGLKLTCDCYFYCAILGTLGFMQYLPLWFNVLPLLAGIGSGIGYAMKERGEKWRFIPLLLQLTLFFLKPGKLCVFLMLPILVYSWFYVRGNRHVTDHYYAMQRFRIGMILLGFCLMAMLMIAPETFVSEIPPLFMHLTLSVTLLRMLRHDEHIIRQKRFQMINVAGILGMCLAGVFLSTDIVLKALKWLLGILYRYALLPVLNVILFAVKIVCGVLEWLFSRFTFSMSLGDGDMPQMDLGGGQMFDLPEDAEAMVANPVVKRILEIIGIVLLVVIVVIVLKKLSEQRDHEKEAEHEEERESLDEALGRRPGLAERLRARRDPVEGVRAVYRRYLTMAENSGAALNGRQNSLQIRDMTEAAFDNAALDDLRSVYIRARYDADAKPEDVAKAKDAVARMKKK